MARAPLAAPLLAPLRALALLACLVSARAQAIQDSRCYLMGGGAVESFFISEDTPVGAVIGTLSVNGDPSETGDISLSVQERGAGVALAPGTKNVTLARALDREERQGPASVYVNVRCDRRRTTDPSFVIPVSVRVWDVNDNAPAWVGLSPQGDYRARLSEAAAVGTRVPVALRAEDRDQPGPHSTLHYSVLPGPHSDYFSFPNELESVLVVAKPLDFEAARNLSVRLRAQDQGSPPLQADATLALEVLDADDQNPRFTHDHYTALVPHDVREGAVLETRPGPVAAADGDLGIGAPLAFSSAGERRHLVAVDRDSGRLSATARLRTAQLPATVVIKATQVDNPDRYALATVSLAREGEGEGQREGEGEGEGATGEEGAVAFSQRAFEASVREDAPPGTVLATLHTRPARPHHKPPLQFYVSERSFLEAFAINARGEVVLRRPLDYEATRGYHYQVMVTDGVTNDTASLNISVVNVNEWEPRFRYPQYEFRVEDDGSGSASTSTGPGLLPVGRLDVHDGDAPDTVALTLRGNDAHMLYVNGAGEVFLRREALAALNTSVLHVVATAVDSGQPPRQTSVPVLVHVGELAGRVARGASRGLAGAGLAGALALLVLLLLAVLAALYRRRRTKSSPDASPPPKSPFLPHAPEAGPGVAPVGAPGAALRAASSDSLRSVSAGASTILANSSSSLDLRADSLPQHNRGASTRQSTRHPAKSKVAPLPPSLPPSEALMSDHLRAGPGRSGVAWPSQTIPARVKKLSWDDAADTAQHKGSDPPPAPGATSAPPQPDHLNLTVYF